MKLWFTLLVAGLCCLDASTGDGQVTAAASDALDNREVEGQRRASIGSSDTTGQTLTLRLRLIDTVDANDGDATTTTPAIQQQAISIDGSSAADTSPDDLRKRIMHTPDGRKFVNIDNVLYPLECERRDWRHSEDKSSCTALGFIMKGGAITTIFEESSEYRHVTEKPGTPEKWLGVLWKKQDTLVRTKNEHRYEGLAYAPLEFRVGNVRAAGTVPLPFKGEAFRIYESRYELDIVTLILGDAGVREETVLTGVLNCRFIPTGNETLKKKSGQPWTSDPSGQGSSGEQPKSDEAARARFAVVYPEFAAHFSS